MGAWVERRLELIERELPYFEDPGRYLVLLRDMARERWGEARVFIFGSWVRGEARPGKSDIDVAVVSPRAPQRVHEKSEFIYEFLRRIGDLTAPFEIHVLRPEEWENYYRPFVKEDQREI